MNSHKESEVEETEILDTIGQSDNYCHTLEANDWTSQLDIFEEFPPYDLERLSFHHSAPKLNFAFHGLEETFFVISSSKHDTFGREQIV